VLVILLITLGSKGSGSPSAAASSPAPNPAASAAAKAKAAAQAKAVSACFARKPASGQLYVRTTEPGLQANASELGANWSWDYVTGTCMDAMDSTIAGAGTADGECTTVGYVADNPGYDANAVPAPPLPAVANEAGPGC
jgi:hypothetical protein